MMRCVALAAVIAGCGARIHRAPVAVTGDDVTLYRDVALIHQRVELDLPATPITKIVQLAAGVAPDQVVVLDRGGIAIGATRAVGEADPAGGAPAARPTALALALTAPRAGRYAIVLAYVTDTLRWDAAYTLTATPARDRAVLHGAIAIRNATGIVLHGRTRG